MTDYGVTSAGFVRKPFEVIAEEMRTKIRGAWGATVDLTPDSDFGQIIDTVAVKLAEAWEVTEAAYAAYDPDQAEDASLDAVMALTGGGGGGATKTRVLLDVNVDPGTYAIGDLVASVTGDPTRRFVNLVEVVNATLAAYTIAGVDFEAEDAGPLVANAGTVEVMASAVSGWNSVTNIADAYKLGSDVEKDAPARARREQELGSQGSANVVAIRAALLAFERDDKSKPILRVTVLENVGDTTDSDGLLPHTIEAIVHAPTATDDEIAEIIFRTTTGGIGTNGTTSVNVVDVQDKTHVIKFSRPTTLDAYATVTLEVDADTYAGDTAVAVSLASTDTDFGPGEKLLWTKIIGDAYGVTGVKRVVSFGLSTSGGGPFTQTDITPTARQVVSLDSANVTVTS